MVNNSNDEFVAGFLSQIINENTAAAYRVDLAQFSDFLESRFFGGGLLHWKRVTKSMVILFVKNRREARYSESSVARKVAAIKSFFGYLHLAGLIPQNPTKELESPSVRKNLPRALSLDQINKLLEQTTKGAEPEDVRDHALLELLYATGIRAEELVLLNVADVSPEEVGAKIRCRRRDGSERYVPVHEVARRSLECYIEDYRPILLKGNRREPGLFVNSRGERLTRQGIWGIIKRHARKAGIEQEVSARTLRHTFATHLRAGGAPLEVVRQLLGHTHTSTTLVYDRLASRNQKVYKETHPKAG